MYGTVCRPLTPAPIHADCRHAVSGGQCPLQKKLKGESHMKLSTKARMEWRRAAEERRELVKLMKSLLDDSDIKSYMQLCKVEKQLFELSDAWFDIMQAINAEGLKDFDL